LPYIRTQDRLDLQSGKSPETAGELNYGFTVLAIEYMTKKGKSYATINDIMGALEGAKAEFYRRVAAPYEDTKIKENGDVY
jgi:hypothetical protein